MSFLCLSGPAAHADDTLAVTSVWQDTRESAERRVDDLLRHLTQNEKLSLFALKSDSDAFKLDIPAIVRLGLPPLRTTDAPQAVRIPKSTAYPFEVVMASTWDPALIRQVGAGIGMETRAKGRQVLYGPCLNIHRTPQNGRFFENMSEDPFLTGQMAIPYIEGMQSQHVAACAKHFICNDQESGRHDISVEVDERALHEIYLPPFYSALVKAKAWSLMPALMKVNGVFIAERKDLVPGLVEREWRWDGLVIGDWGAVRDTAAALNGGTDIEMPDPKFYTPASIAQALQNGRVTQELIDDRARRVLRLMLRTGVLDNARAPDERTAVNTPEHQAVARRVAEEGITLLKNERRLLPLDRMRVKKIAVIGPNAQDTPLGGRWSADTTPFSTVNVVDGIRKAAGGGVSVTYSQGCPRTGAGTSEALKSAADLAARSDVAVVVVGTDSSTQGEELDPASLYLPGDQDKLIQTVASVNKKTIVVLNNGGPILMDRWVSKIPGLLEAWYAGQETGTAVAEILFGSVNPSGKLADTIAARREQYSDWPNYPGANGKVVYAEGIYVGYRHFDKAGIAPLFPFGFGLSYTTFSLDRLRAPRFVKSGSDIRVRVRVRNTGEHAGAEVVQVYVRPLNPKMDRPVRELKGFQRVTLDPGQWADVTIPLGGGAFSYWDVETHRWKSDPGRYAIDVGVSSRDIRLSHAIVLN